MECEKRGIKKIRMHGHGILLKLFQGSTTHACSNPGLIWTIPHRGKKGKVNDPNIIKEI